MLVVAERQKVSCSHFDLPLVTTTHTCRSAHPCVCHFKLIPKFGWQGLPISSIYLNFSLLRKSVTEEFQSYHSQAAGKLKHIKISTLEQVRIKMADST